MRRLGWKVPTVLLAATLAGACGGEAESAADSGSERVIPASGSAPGSELRTDEVGAAPEAGLPAGGVEEAPAAELRAPRTAEAAEVAGVTGDPEPVPEAEAEVPEPPSIRARPQDEATPRRDEPVTAPPPEMVRTDPEPSVAPTEGFETRPEAEPAVEPREPLAVPVGTRIPLTVDEELSTRVSVTGDPFDATVAEDVLGSDGVVLLPHGTRVRGRVLESFESPASDRPATLALGVEAVELGGRTLPVAATAVELEHESEARDSDGRSAAKVGAGAVAGALLGRIIGGDGGDAVKGAVAGALAGAAVAHATRDGHAVVPRGARLVVVLDERLVVEPLPAPVAEASGG